MKFRVSVCFVAGIFCAPISAQYTPTISGTFNAFWYLGSNILSDGGSCTSGETGPCYYAVDQLTSNSNGAPGDPSWTVVQNGAGRISLSCQNCANPIATALSPSGGCYSDIQVYVSYGGYTSDPFNITIVVPSYTILQANYPTNGPWYPNGWVGFQSTYLWGVYDSCNYEDSGIDANEALGNYYADESTDWRAGNANGVYMDTYLVSDTIGFAGIGNTPSSQAPPQNGPLSTEKVFHNYPWRLLLGSQTIGLGTAVRSDTQQFWRDHGTHY